MRWFWFRRFRKSKKFRTLVIVLYLHLILLQLSRNVHRSAEVTSGSITQNYLESSYFNSSDASGSSSSSDNDDDDADTSTFHIDIQKRDPKAWANLPVWAQKYFTWHAEMRAKYPDTALLTDPDAPGVLVRSCNARCGGTQDRMQRLHLFVALAALTNRVALIKWCYPTDLEHFLVPNIVNWTLPSGNLDMDRFCKVPLYNQLERPVNLAWHFEARQNVSLAEWVRRYVPKENYRVVLESSLMYRIRQPKIPKQIARSAIEDKGAHSFEMTEIRLLDTRATFSAIFNAMFRPSDRVQARIDNVYRETNLASGTNYAATHIRVRHPGFSEHAYNEHEFDFHNISRTDLGLKNKVIQAALTAVLCTVKFAANPAYKDSSAAIDNSTRPNQEPIYFLSDSSELVNYLVFDNHADPKITNVEGAIKTTNNGKNQGLEKTAAELERKIWALKQKYHIVSRNVSASPPAINIDIATDSTGPTPTEPEAFMDTFVDLYMAINARCVGFGVGNFGYLATMISGTNCYGVHSYTFEAKFWNRHKVGQDRFCRITHEEEDELLAVVATS